MAKLDKYMAGRQDGMLLALQIVKDGGVEALEKELEFRNITGIHTMLAHKDLEKATEKIKNMTVDTFTILSVATLREEFDFGAKRLGRFIARMNNKAECLVADMVTWQDFIDDIKEDLGIELTLRRND